VSKGVARSIVKPIEAIDLDSLDCECVYPELAPILSRLSVQRKHDTFERARRELLHREYVANVSHELKTPLTSISGFAEIMKSGETDANTVVDFSNAIYDEAQRLITLVNDIIKVSELDGGATHLTMEPVDLLGIVHSTVRRLKPQADRDAITVRVVGGETLVLGVPKVLDEMLYNLCDNAIKYNHPHGSVVVTLTSGGGVATVTVEDTGIGIPKVHQERVFERFYRVDKSHSKAIGGTGLGLSIVKHGAIYHDAKLSLVSREGVGTVVTLEFRALGVPLH
jgi:two-component system phosphate regulon sensor histidine kinase PhoR